MAAEATHPVGLSSIRSSPLNTLPMVQKTDTHQRTNTAGLFHRLDAKESARWGWSALGLAHSVRLTFPLATKAGMFSLNHFHFSASPASTCTTWTAAAAAAEEAATAADVQVGNGKKSFNFISCVPACQRRKECSSARDPWLKPSLPTRHQTPTELASSTSNSDNSNDNKHEEAPLCTRPPAPPPRLVSCSVCRIAQTWWMSSLAVRLKPPM